MSSRQAYPALPPADDAICASCAVPYRRIDVGPGRSRIIVRHRLKLVLVAGHLARLCDRCRKLHRQYGRAEVAA